MWLAISIGCIVYVLTVLAICRAMYGGELDIVAARSKEHEAFCRWLREQSESSRKEWEEAAVFVDVVESEWK